VSDDVPADPCLGAGSSVTVQWSGEGTRFTADAGGARVLLSSDDEGPEAGPCPMDLLLIATGGCTGIDLVELLRKMRQPVEGLRIEVNGLEREEYPRIWTDIEVVYHLKGDLDEAKVQRAIELSETKYCCVEGQLCGTARISSRYEIAR
jgi:putative redox protein